MEHRRRDRAEGCEQVFEGFDGLRRNRWQLGPVLVQDIVAEVDRVFRVAWPLSWNRRLACAPRDGRWLDCRLRTGGRQAPAGRAVNGGSLCRKGLRSFS